LFVNSNSTYSIWPDADIHADFIENALTIAKIDDEKKRKLALNNFVTNTLDYLLHNYDVEHNNNNSLINVDPDLLIKLNKVEKRLKDCLLTEFPGIEVLAAEINVSPAKLKTDFKNYFGDSIYQYYLSKQLLFAHDLLAIHHKSVGETAEILGYKNIGKFTVAFEKKFGMLPSKVTKL
jgi:AraC-like DNA-binding protein